jgi:hypothetical protein
MRKKLRRRKANRAKSKLGLPDLEQAKSAVLVSLGHLNRSAVIAVLLRILFAGTARNLGCHSTKQW